MIDKSIPRWYSYNFSNEQVVQGKQTIFLRFQNTTHLVPASDNISNNEDIWVLPIVEFINVDPSDTSNDGVVFINGVDANKLQQVFKDGIPPTPGTSNYNSVPYFWYGGPETGATNINQYHQPFPPEIPDFTKVEINNAGTVESKWVDGSIRGSTGPTFPNPGEKHNFRIDYTGKKAIGFKITFLITTKSVNAPDFFDSLPEINPGVGLEEIGDIQEVAGNFEYWDGAWQPLEDSSSTQYSFANSPTYGIKHLHELDYFFPGPTWNGDWHDYQETYMFFYPEGDKKPMRDTSYWIDKKLSEDVVNDDTSSFSLMRTNPKISGNIKLVVDSSGGIFMDTIEANDELSNAKYKKNKISPNGSFAVDVNKFFSSLSPEIMYDLQQRDDQYLNAKQSYAEQYDFFYGYGASQLPSKYYDEQFKLFAPIWVRKELPEFFVIFKVLGPLNKETYFDNDRKDLISELLQNAKVLKTFDLRPGSNIGEYIGNVVKDPRFNEQPLKISYEDDTLSTWSGVSYKDGIMAEKGEFLYDFFKTDRSVNDFEEVITDGFERNQMISTNLFNLEFLFDDNESESYEINRYFGMYINEIELAKFEIYGDAFPKIPNQLPLPKKDVDAEAYSLKPFNQTNANGIIIPVDYYQGISPIGTAPEKQGFVQGKLPLTQSVDDYLRFFYVRDREDNIDRIKSLKEYEYSVPTSSDYIKYTGLELYDTSANITNYGGIARMTAQLPSKLLDKGHSQMVITFDETITGEQILESLETIEIEWIDINQEKQLWQCIANPTGLQKGDAWNFPVYNPDELRYVNTFSPEGSTEDVAKAFTACINSFENSAVTAWQKDSSVYIKAELAGTVGNGFIIRRKMISNSIIDNLKFYSYTPTLGNSYTNTLTQTGGSTVGDITDFALTATSAILTDYEVKIIGIYDNPLYPGVYDTVTVEVRKNGGLIDTKILILQNDNVYNDNGITFTIEYDSGTTVYNINDTWTFERTNKNVAQRFIGGNDRNRARGSVLTTDALNIKPNDWYQTQKSKYSRLKSWDVQGNSVYKLFNLEDPILDNASQLSGYTDLNTKQIIQVADKDFEFYQTLEKRIVSFDAFEPTLGLMSFLPIKDFDFDWLLSDYAYSPNAELDRYYETYNVKANETVELELNQSYEITEGSVELEGYNSVTNLWENIDLSSSSQIWSGNVVYDTTNVSNFNTYLPNYYYDTGESSSDKLGTGAGKYNYFYRNYKALSQLANYTKLRVGGSVDSKIIKYNYAQDANLSAFNGFLGLADFFSVEDEDELEKLIAENSIDRFFFDQLISEYDRLRENFNKDYAVKSRVVPYINKWAQTGTDCRDNKYRLNNSFAFGLTNFSPDTEIKERNPRLHTHEFYYLDEYPSDYPSDSLASSRSHFSQNISDPVYNGKSWYELFQQNDNDWFSKYFTIGYPNELDADGNKVSAKTQERYIFTDFVPGDESAQGLFRGGKFKILDIDPITNEVISGSKKYDGYKFSSILRIKNLAFNLTEPPAEYEFITNDKYKTAVFVITLYINDYRIQDGGYGYLFLYAGIDNLRSSSIKNDNMLFAPRTAPSTVPYADSSFLIGHEIQRHFESFRGGTLVDYADTKLNGIFDTTISPITAKPRTLQGINVTDKEFIPSNEIFPIDGNDYDMKTFYNPGDDFGQTAINVMERGAYSEFSQYFPGYPNAIPSNYIVNNQPGLDQNIAVTSESVILDGDINLPYSSKGSITSTTGFPTRKREQVPTYSIDESFVFSTNWYLSGGKGYLQKRLEEISFAEILTLVNDEDSAIKYLTVTDDGASTGNYKFRFIDFDRIIKENRLNIVEDTDKPPVYTSVETIGFDIIDTKDTETVFRHRGRFEPKAYRVINYWAREDSTMTTHYNTDYLLSNTRWGTDYRNFGFINNLFFGKVSDGQLMKIATSSEYQSKYPLINELAIANKDMYLFNSNWDNNYYNFYDTTATSVPKEGTLELIEQKSFFGSKLMLTPNVFEIQTFNSDELSYEVVQALSSTDVGPLENETSQVLPSAKKGKVIVTINADNRLIREMIENDAALEFEKLKLAGYTRFASLTDDEIIEETKKYLRANILNLYNVTDVAVYIKSDAIEGTDEIVRIDLTEAQKRELNYILSKNATVNQTDNFIFKVELDIDTKKYRSFSFSITLERI